MAEKRVIELEVKLGASKKAIDDLTKSTTDLSASFEDVYGEMQPLSGRMGELEDRLYELALAGKQNTQEYKDLQAEIAKFKKVIAETDASVDGASGTMSQKLGGALGGVTAGFELAQGAMGAFGVESQDVEAALLKVQSAMAISQGVQGIKEAIPSFKSLGTTATNAFQNMTAAGKAFAVTGIGLLITGVGLLISNFDTLKAAFGGITEKQKALNSTIEDYKEGTKEAIKQTTDVANAFDLAKKGVISKKEALRVYNDTLGDSFGKAKNLNEAEKLYNEKTEAYIKATALRAQAQALFTKSAEEAANAITSQLEDQRSFVEETTGIVTDAAAGAIDYITGGFTDLSKKADKIQGTIYKGAKARAKKESEDRKKIFEDLGKDLLNQAATLEKQFNIQSDTASTIAKEQAEKAKEAAEKAAEAKKDALEKIKEAEKEYRLYQMTEQDKEIFEANKKYNELVKLAKKYGKDTTQLEEARRNALNDITAKYIQTELDFQEKVEADKKAKDKAEKDRLETLRREQIGIEEAFYDEYNAALLTQQQTEVQAVTDKYFRLIEEAKKYGLSTIELEEKMNKEVADINKKYSETTKAQKIQAVQDTLSTIGNLAILFAGQNEKQQKKAFQIQKAANIANATIDTYKAATGAYASLSGIPVVGPVLGAVAAAAAITAGLVNVKNIASQKFEGGGSISASPAPSGGGGGGGATGGNVVAPNFNLVGNAQATNPLAGLGEGLIQAYVVSGDVTTAQSLDRNRVNNATFG
jgi:uncharacterized coiled-coil protein SlyX